MFTVDCISVRVDVPHNLSRQMFEQPWVVLGLLERVVVALFAMFNLIELCILRPLTLAVGALMMASNILSAATRSCKILVGNLSASNCKLDI
jgi:hypothetical protein